MRVSRALTALSILVCLLAMSGFGLAADDCCKLAQTADNDVQLVRPTSTAPAAMSPENRGNYDGRVKVYVVEIKSRWEDASFNDFHNAFLDFAIDTSVSIPYQETFHKVKTWDGASAGYGDLTQSNVMVIAVVHSSIRHTAYSDPPSGSPFNAYYSDAAAYATSGGTGSNIADQTYTHTVFVEEGSTTWCPHCPTNSAVIQYIFASGNYNFIFATMVTDVCPKASQHMGEYNLTYVPTGYYDAGFITYVGESSSQATYTSRILSAGQREVPPLDLTVSMDWLGSASIEVDVSVTNNYYVNTAPGVPAMPAGPAEGIASFDYTFSASDEDPDGDRLYYQWNWGDGEMSDWLGPYDSGEAANADHTWAATGIYGIAVRAKDEADNEGNWSQATSIEIGVAGDSNGDDAVNAGDAVALINYVFKSGNPPVPLEAGDANCDSAVNAGDAVRIINYVFKNGPAPGCQQ